MTEANDCNFIFYPMVNLFELWSIKILNLNYTYKCARTSIHTSASMYPTTSNGALQSHKLQ